MPQITLCIIRTNIVLYYDLDAFINLNGELVAHGINMHNVTNAIRILFKYYPDYHLSSCNSHGACIDYHFTR
jgi:hypothetical protein